MADKLSERLELKRDAWSGTEFGDDICELLDEAAELARRVEWRPIETAPTGHEILTWHDFGRPVSNPAHPSYGKSGEVLVQKRMRGGSFDSELLSSGVVTHWMPLPEPPEVG